MSELRYVCSRCGFLLPQPPPNATGWTCEEIREGGKACRGLPTSILLPLDDVRRVLEQTAKKETNK